MIQYQQQQNIWSTSQGIKKRKFDSVFYFKKPSKLEARKVIKNLIIVTACQNGGTPRKVIKLIKIFLPVLSLKILTTVSIKMYFQMT